jgi:hypothetical protein
MSAAGGWQGGSALTLIVPLVLAITSAGGLLGIRSAARGVLGTGAAGAGIGVAFLIFQLPGLTTPDGGRILPFADGPALLATSVATLACCVPASLLALRAQRRKLWPWDLASAT